MGNSYMALFNTRRPVQAWSQSLLVCFILVVGTACEDRSVDTTPVAHNPSPGPSGLVRLTAEELSRMRLELSPVVQGEILSHRELPATVQANQNELAEVTALIRGRVVKVYVDLGQDVKKGMLLAQLHSVDLGVPREEIERLDREHTIKADMPLRAPFDGRVITRNITRGEVVETDQTLFTVVNLTDVWVIGKVPEKDIRFIRKDQSVNVVLAAYPYAIFKGTITYVGDMLDPSTRTMRLRITMPNPERLLKPEMFTIVSVYVASSGDALSVPLAAVQDGPVGKMVFVQGETGTFEARTVTLGNEEGDVVRVLEGVKTGEQVVTKGSFALKSEMERHKIEPTS
ncbi:MAG TPA: efflux RND transporter periplasmic adaptor subunit [Nitrospira sp.]|nr:efflux RND transporter periplasmic adaptor subunit [Nitrospira sp.]